MNERHNARREQAAFLALADELRAAIDSPDEAHSLPGWPDDGCAGGCLCCVEKWLRTRLAAAS